MKKQYHFRYLFEYKNTIPTLKRIPRCVVIKEWCVILYQVLALKDVKKNWGLWHIVSNRWRLVLNHVTDCFQGVDNFGIRNFALLWKKMNVHLKCMFRLIFCHIFLNNKGEISFLNWQSKINISAIWYDSHTIQTLFWFIWSPFCVKMTLI